MSEFKYHKCDFCGEETMLTLVDGFNRRTCFKTECKAQFFKVIE